jgi:N-acetylmuramoyl-L-alanine amidase
MRWMPLIAALTMPVLAGLVSAGASAQQAPVAAPTSAVAATKKTTGPKAVPFAGTRFVVGLDEAIELHDVKIQQLDNPSRLLIDLPRIVVSLPDQPKANAPVGVVKSFQHMPGAPAKMRIVVDLTGPVTFEKAIEKAPDGNGDRLVVKIVAVKEIKPPVPTPAVRSTKKTIVIDPGHGGHDSGARKFGTVEKDVVLSFSLKLREKLDETGFYKVVMTRDTDIFLPLGERRRIGERHQAALFIAIHADYTQRASARGATIYSLRPHVAQMLKRAVGDITLDTAGKKLALADTADAGAVKGILAEKARDLIDRNQLRTSLFARSLIKYVGTSTNLMENPDRNAGFAVLRTAKVPAILLELGYVTNEEDAAQLKSDEWRDRVASAMVAAINKYVGDCLEKPAC